MQGRACRPSRSRALAQATADEYTTRMGAPAATPARSAAAASALSRVDDGENNGSRESRRVVWTAAAAGVRRGMRAYTYLLHLLVQVRRMAVSAPATSTQREPMRRGARRGPVWFTGAGFVVFFFLPRSPFCPNCPQEDAKLSLPGNTECEHSLRSVCHSPLSLSLSSLFGGSATWRRIRFCCRSTASYSDCRNIELELIW